MVPVCVSACAKPVPLETFTIVVTAKTEDGEAIQGAKYPAVLFPDLAPVTLAATGRDGTSTTVVRAREGAQLEIEVGCPEEYRAVEPRIRVTLQRVSNIAAQAALPVHTAI